MPEATTTTTTPAAAAAPKPGRPPPPKYYAMVVDSGPIIKQDVRNLMGKAETYVTTPSVLREIRDSKARDHLEHSVLPLLDLKVRDPTDKSIQEIIAFSKQTGDYAGLSTVDLQVLALALDLEKEGNLVRGNTTTLDHIRTTPKRKIGLGSIVPMNGKSAAATNSAKKDATTPAAPQEEKKGDDGDDAAADSAAADPEQTEEQTPGPLLLGRDDYDEVVEDSDDDDDEETEAVTDLASEEDEEGNPQEPVEGTEGAATASAAAPPVQQAPARSQPPVRRTWATLVNPAAASATTPLEQDAPPGLAFSAMTLSDRARAERSSNNDDDDDDADSTGGQFDDASEDEEDVAATEEELQQEFPSLLAASAVSYEGEDDEILARQHGEDGAESKKKINDGNDARDLANPHKTRASVFMTEEEKQRNLQPVSKSGRTYNSFRKYKGLMKPKQPKKKTELPVEEDTKDDDEAATALSPGDSTAPAATTQQQATRFLGGGGGGETMLEEDDDGQGWITSSDDIRFLKNEGGGRLDPGKTGTAGGPDNNKGGSSKNAGPPLSQRTACATTDFAMQNVLLQMNLHLLSSEGMRIRRLKSWVIRCGACFHIHSAEQDFKDETNHHMKRLFCSHCGSDMLQRISASVDGKTGRLKLHFSKRKQGRHHSIRGTKFSLPKPGSGNKYKGDLLLREDQLLSGAWNQKVKINSGKKYQTSRSQSMFGRDIASSVGCNVKSTSSASFGGKGWSNSANTSSVGGFGTNTDDIRVGFGARKNPNASKGRERRGKKKKSSDRACGMRRY